ncbi:MAG: hypothetical protein OCD00_14890 [Colwellia sp.]
MVSSIGGDSGQSSVVQVFKQQQARVEQQKNQQADDKARQVSLDDAQRVKTEIQQQARAEQRQSDQDDRRGRSVDVSV